MAGYRDTLKLPQTEFPMKADLPRREPDRLRWWNERGCYGALRERRRGAPVWLLHDGPPYSNAHLHMGTAANKIWKDAAIRVHSLFGFDSPYVPGWDNHGMPIEVQVMKELRQSGGAMPERGTLRASCREYAARWVAIQREEFGRLGIWGSWDRPYLTMDHAFEAEIIETFAGLAERGFIQRGLRSIHWCPTDRTALAEAEIEYQDDPSPSLFVTFPLRRDPEQVLAAWPGVRAVAWTTTPWTLPANLGLMVDPAAAYAIVAAAGGRFLLAEARVAAVAEVCGWKEHRVETRVPGAALVGLIFEAPFGNDSRVVDGTPFVSLDDGTGLVHTAPGHGKEDFAVGQRSGLGVVCPVDEAGRFTSEVEGFVGRSVLDVNDDIIRRLEDAGRVLAAGSLTHSYPHCWRCRKPVIFRATEQWFMIIDHDGHRDRALEAIDRHTRWEPETSRNRIREAVRTRPDWCLSRQRSWGVGIPAVYCEACDTALLDPAVMKRAAEHARSSGSDAWYALPVEEFLPKDFRCSSCGKPGPFRKETDILDVWFDSGSTFRAVQVTHPELREPWARALASGGVCYFEGPDQHRGWFNSSLMVGVGLDRKAPYTDVCTHGWVLDGDGRAMHKSLGNVVWPNDLVNRYGADVVRWWAMSTDWRTDVRIGDEIMQRVSDAYRKVRNTLRFLLGNLSDFDAATHALPEDRLLEIDRAFLGALRSATQRARQAYDRLQYHRALDILLQVCTVDLSAVYLDVTKDRLYTHAADDVARRSAQTVLWEALRRLTVVASPALVFTSEEAWQHHASLTALCPSVHLADWPDDPAAAGLEAEWEFLIALRETVNASIEPLRASKVLSTTTEAAVRLTVSPEALRRLERYRGEIAGLLLVAEIDLRPGALSGDAATRGWEVAEVRRTAHGKCERCWTFRPDVATEGPRTGLCGRCAAVLDATGQEARAKA